MRWLGSSRQADKVARPRDQAERPGQVYSVMESRVSRESVLGEVRLLESGSFHSQTDSYELKML